VISSIAHPNIKLNLNKISMKINYIITLSRIATPYPSRSPYARFRRKKKKGGKEK